MKRYPLTILFLITNILVYSLNLDVSTFAIDNGEWWKLITGAFMHLNINHLLGNMIIGLPFIAMLEYKLGSTKTLFICLVSLTISGLAIINYGRITLGFSGVLYGALGSLLYLTIQGRLTKFQSLFIIAFITKSIIITFIANGVSIPSHIGGMIGGLIAMVTLELIYKGGIQWQRHLRL